MLRLSPACQPLLKGAVMSFENSFPVADRGIFKPAGKAAAHLSLLLKEFGSTN
jgi:hypothetical protein